MSTQDNELDDNVTQRVVPAAGATPPATRAASSIFALGQAAGAEANVAGEEGIPPDGDFAAPTRAKPRDTAELKSQALKSIESCGELTAVQLAEVLGVSKSVASKLITGLVNIDKAVKVVRKQGTTPFYGLARSGLKGWLRKQAEPGAQVKSSKPAKATKAAKAPGKKRGRPSRADCAAQLAAAMTQAAQPVAVAQPTAADWRCSLCSTGHLVIEANGAKVELNANQARAVSAWMARVDAAMLAALGAAA